MLKLVSLILSLMTLPALADSIDEQLKGSKPTNSEQSKESEYEPPKVRTDERQAIGAAVLQFTQGDLTYRGFGLSYSESKMTYASGVWYELSLAHAFAAPKGANAIMDRNYKIEGSATFLLLDAKAMLLSSAYGVVVGLQRSEIKYTDTEFGHLNAKYSNVFPVAGLNFGVGGFMERYAAQLSWRFLFRCYNPKGSLSGAVSSNDVGAIRSEAKAAGSSSMDFGLSIYYVLK